MATAKRWTFSCDSDNSLRVCYEDGSPLMNAKAKAAYGAVHDILPSAVPGAPPHAIDVSAMIQNNY